MNTVKTRQNLWIKQNFIWKTFLLLEILNFFPKTIFINFFKFHFINKIFFLYFFKFYF